MLGFHNAMRFFDVLYVSQGLLPDSVSRETLIPNIEIT